MKVKRYKNFNLIFLFFLLIYFIYLKEYIYIWSIYIDIIDNFRMIDDIDNWDGDRR